MQCPVCQAELRMSERHNIEIDYCPTCRGIWLDRGELDKIIERATREMPSEIATPRAEWEGAPPSQSTLPTQPMAPPQPMPQPQYPVPQYSSPQYPPRKKYDDDDHYRGGQYPHGHKRKKKNFLEDLFDFD